MHLSIHSQRRIDLEFRGKPILKIEGVSMSALNVKFIVLFPIMFTLASCGGGPSSAASNKAPVAPAPEALKVKSLPQQVVLFSTGE